MNSVSIVAIAIGAGLLSWLGAWRLIHTLKRRDILDRPNQRSSHAAPTPRGGGIAVIGAILVAWAAIALFTRAPSDMWVVLGAALGLAMLSWRDDRVGLPVHVRLVGQAMAVTAALAATPGAGGLFGSWMPAWLGAVAIGLAWLWFVNLFNFMDGIDGLDGGEALSIGIGVVAVVVFARADLPLAAMGAAAAAAALGFLAWNWHPARIFLGDVGSVPLGFLFGFLLLRLAEAGQWVAALILPAYFLADATLTLLVRAMKGEPVWQAHKQHFYQRAVQGGLSHAQVAGRVLAANALLIATSLLAPGGHAALALGAAVLIVAGLLALLARAR